MTTTRFRWVGLATLLAIALPVSANAQEVGSITGSPGPGTPYLTETVLPVPNVRLQMDFVPATRNIGTESVSDFLVPWRLSGAWNFTESVIGEASIPFLMSFPGAEGAESAFEVGNPKISIEWPVYTVGQRHRLSLSYDMYIPLAQYNWGDPTLNIATGGLDYDQAQLDKARVRRGRFLTASTLLPYLQPDYLPETLTLLLGVHYRLTQGDWALHVNLDTAAYLGFDFSQTKLFHENFFGLRYGFEVVYEARPVYPSLELVGVTNFATDNPWTLPDERQVRLESTTAVLAALGVRFALAQWEPGIAVTYPITLGGDADDIFSTSVYINLNVAYRFD